MVSPKPIHWMAMKPIHCFLSHSQRFGIILRKAVDYGVIAYYSIDWGDDTIDQKSRTEFWTMLEEAWCLGSPRSKACSCDQAPRQSPKWWQRRHRRSKSMLGELEVNVFMPTTILIDNLGTTFINRNPIGHIKLKHISLDLDFFT